jgi:hypothetical protein
VIKIVKMRNNSYKTQLSPHESLHLIKNKMLRFLPCLFVTSFSAQVLVGPCTDVGDGDFGDCDMVLGIAIVNGGCFYLSGCGWEVDGVDYSPAFYDTLEECNSSCFKNICINVDQINTSIPCPLAFVPVCGCDGVTYDNECEAYNYGGVTTWTDGVCAPIEINPCTDLGGVSFGLCLAILGVANVNGSCTGVSGCSTYANGVDYSSAFYETINECELAWADGQCGDIGGCTYNVALNFNPDASWDDGSCDFSACMSECVGDVDGDSSVSVGDILVVLANFGLVCPE